MTSLRSFSRCSKQPGEYCRIHNRHPSQETIEEFFGSSKLRNEKVDRPRVFHLVDDFDDPWADDDEEKDIDENAEYFNGWVKDERIEANIAHEQNRYNVKLTDHYYDHVQLSERLRNEIIEYQSARDRAYRVAFLKESKAVPTPKEAYALWVALYEAQGGKVFHKASNYDTALTFSPEPKEAGTYLSKEYLSGDCWMPTEKPTRGIPAGYGSNSMTIMLLPESASAKDFPATEDKREGSQWGHSTVFAIVPDPMSKYGFRAWTNKTNSLMIHSYSDIDSLTKGKDVQDLIQLVSFKIPNDGLLNKQAKKSSF